MWVDNYLLLFYRFKLLPLYCETVRFYLPYVCWSCILRYKLAHGEQIGEENVHPRSQHLTVKIHTSFGGDTLTFVSEVHHSTTMSGGQRITVPSQILDHFLLVVKDCRRRVKVYRFSRSEVGPLPLLISSDNFPLASHLLDPVKGESKDKGLIHIFAGKREREFWGNFIVRVFKKKASQNFPQFIHWKTTSS